MTSSRFMCEIYSIPYSHSMVTIGRDQRPHHRMLGLMGLQIADAAAFLATRTADHLVQELERALGRARIAVAQPEISVNDADQIELGKMVTLGDQLRADHDVDQ